MEVKYNRPLTFTEKVIVGALLLSIVLQATLLYSVYQIHVKLNELEASISSLAETVSELETSVSQLNKYIENHTVGDYIKASDFVSVEINCPYFLHLTPSQVIGKNTTVLQVLGKALVTQYADPIKIQDGVITSVCGIASDSVHQWAVYCNGAQVPLDYVVSHTDSIKLLYGEVPIHETVY